MRRRKNFTRDVCFFYYLCQTLMCHIHSPLINYTHRSQHVQFHFIYLSFLYFILLFSFGQFSQVMLYVDGMNGVMQHGPTVQWLYTLIASKYRLVVKTALKLLLVFVEYCEGNCYLLVNAIRTVDNARGTLPWSNIMK